MSAVVVNDRNKIVDFIVLRRSTEIKNEWVQARILPAMTDIIEMNMSYVEMLERFTTFYLKWKHSMNFVTNLSYIAGAKIFRDMCENKLVGDFDCPLPLYDIASMISMFEGHYSVSQYVKRYNINVYGQETKEYNPLYEALCIAAVYDDLMRRKRELNEL